jgi:hypothetical protein
MEPQSEPHLPLVDTLTREIGYSGGFRVTVGADYAAADIHPRYVRARVGKVRSVGEVERLRPSIGSADGCRNRH